MPMATKPDKVVIHKKELIYINSEGPLITCSCKVT